MSDYSETVEDTGKGSLAEVTDDSCTAKFIETVPLDRPSDDYQRQEFIDPVVEEMKQEAADATDNSDSHCYVKQEPDKYEDKGPCINMQVSLDAHCQQLCCEI